MNTYVWKEIHHLIGHDHGVETTCEHHDQAVHLHDVDPHGSDCYICQFHYAPFKKSSDKLKAFYQIPTTRLANFTLRSIVLGNQLSLPDLRGPPTLA